MRYKAAIFDMDGTILNTLEDLTDSTNYALAHHGFPERTIDEVRRFVGNGIRKLIERAVPAGTDVARCLIHLLLIIRSTVQSRPDHMTEYMML